MPCENNLFIQCSVDKKEFFLERMNNSLKFFESFIPWSGSKEECYGTSSDVYLEYVTFDITIDPDIINMIFFTYETPCIEFCKRFANYYNVNIQLFYYNDELDYSGKYCIHLNQIVCDEYFGYWGGLYLYNPDFFWEIIQSSFEEYPTFASFIENTHIPLNEKHYLELKYKFEEQLLFKEFKRF